VRQFFQQRAGEREFSARWGGEGGKIKIQKNGCGKGRTTQVWNGGQLGREREHEGSSFWEKRGLKGLIKKGNTGEATERGQGRAGPRGRQQQQ